MASGASLLYAVGFDPALRHGAVMYCEFLAQGQKITGLVSARVIYQWTKSSDISLDMRSSPAEVFALTNQLLTSLSRYPYPRGEPPIVSIDWDPTAGYWGARKRQISQSAFMMGYLTYGLHHLGYPVVYLSPRTVRTLLKIPPKSEKGAVHQAIIRRLKIKPAQLKGFYDPEGDILDAIILAYLATQARLVRDLKVKPLSKPSALPGAH